MPTKPKTNYTPEVGMNGKDLFQTPNYATELLIPFIPRDIKTVWECACGPGKIVNCLADHGYNVYPSDLIKFPASNVVDFLQTSFIPENVDGIITNPPFSLKEKFFRKCLEYELPFALLIPADYSSWIIEGVEEYGCEKIIPKRRVSYITPNITDVVWRGEVKRVVEKATGLKWKKFSEIPQKYIDMYAYGVIKYSRWEDIPVKLILKYSAAQFHSLWLTFGFGLGRTETFVELTKEMMQNV